MSQSGWYRSGGAACRQVVVVMLAATTIILAGAGSRVQALAPIMHHHHHHPTIGRRQWAPTSAVDQHRRRPWHEGRGRLLHRCFSSNSSADAAAITVNHVPGMQMAAPPSFASSSSSHPTTTTTSMPAWQATLTKIGMLCFIASMCVMLPLTLLPQRLLRATRLLSRRRSEIWAVHTTETVARWMLRLFPFCHVDIITDTNYIAQTTPVPSIWACNHTSMLDVFLLLAHDRQLRGQHKRPIKIIYWQQLEHNPVTRIMFRQAGFIPVQMRANLAGAPNEYDKTSFKRLLKAVKAAWAEGFDIGILPEGQLNPTPQAGLLPLFAGAYTLAKLSQRPMHFMAIHGAHHLWPATQLDNLRGLTVQGRHVKIRCYPWHWTFSSADEFMTTFRHVVGHFGQYGRDVMPIADWPQQWQPTGAAWRPPQQQHDTTTTTTAAAATATAASSVENKSDD